MSTRTDVKIEEILMLL